ncbi:MAG TPA: hypothetical protein VKM55_16845 [Candidatus Lokiarchaeia archaeon]|nr:hypothetical protein [Candidatus Lokiarchaeia archaeon]
MKGTARHRAAITIIVVVIAVILTNSAPATAYPASNASLHPSSVQDDYNTAWQRLVTYVNGLQSIDGQVPASDVAPVVASLNSALDKLDQAKIAMDKGQLTQASANITQANSIMDSIDSTYKALQAQAQHARLITIASWIGGIAIACVGIITLLFIKRRRDKNKLREFLNAKIDYSSIDSKPDSE